MTNKEILTRITNTKSLKEKYKIKDGEIDEVLRTAGATGKPILQLLYIMVKTAEESNLTTGGTCSHIYKVLKKTFNIS